mmetsp:Transcript_18704/g.51188  ORF Transcript_18704/g.51188 Transcript_18704/m.51188 type:complete len:202 (-) Transcript_18704:339-944(-)
MLGCRSNLGPRRRRRRSCCGILALIDCDLSLFLAVVAEFPRRGSNRQGTTIRRECHFHSQCVGNTRLVQLQPQGLPRTLEQRIVAVLVMTIVRYKLKHLRPTPSHVRLVLFLGRSDGHCLSVLRQGEGVSQPVVERFLVDNAIVVLVVHENVIAHGHPMWKRVQGRLLQMIDADSTSFLLVDSVIGIAPRSSHGQNFAITR